MPEKRRFARLLPVLAKPRKRGHKAGSNVSPHPLRLPFRACRNGGPAAGRAGPEEVSLVAVTKTHEADAILPVLEDGHRVFGENRVQEAKGKWPRSRGAFRDSSFT